MVCLVLYLPLMSALKGGCDTLQNSPVTTDVHYRASRQSLLWFSCSKLAWLRQPRRIHIHIFELLPALQTQRHFESTSGRFMSECLARRSLGQLESLADPISTSQSQATSDHLDLGIQSLSCRVHFRVSVDGNCSCSISSQTLVLIRLIPRNLQ